ncbi:MAG: DUF892 family protein, partial [Chlamydiales bacterium]
MEKNSFYNLFIDLLRETFDAENQMVAHLPVVIKNVANKDLKEGLSTHLEETKQQVLRLKKIFKSLNENPTGRSCQVIKEMLIESGEYLKSSMSPATK